MIILISFYFFLIFHEVSVAVTDDYSLPYMPLDNRTIDCGSSGSNWAFGHRIWEGDVNSKFFDSQNQKNPSNTSTADAPSTQSIPYGTARFSSFEFTYTFHVTPGQKFIRLHFYPVLYQDFDSSKAFFSVKASNYTLLSNFSASLCAQALGIQVVVKEFCLNIAENESVLNITFTPVSSNLGSFAFINGIEVISMPTNLYYTESEKYGAKLLGQFEPYEIKNNTALEMVYRINIGGSYIPAEQDTGMFRNWDVEEDYLTIPGYSTLPLNLWHEINFTKRNPAYTAPINVYQTARSMGNKDRDLIKSYNLTWEFPVDNRFYYLVRLHFCEIQHEIKEVGDRVFLIYIARQTAEDAADVIKWSGGQYVPVHKDYVVAMADGSGEKKLNLSVALQANPRDSESAFADAILNGVEIFKLSDSASNLAGPNPDLTPAAVPPSEQPRKKKNNDRATIIGIVSGAVSGVVILSFIGLFIFRRGRKVKNSSFFDGTTKWGPVSFSTTKSTKTRGSSLPSDLCRYFSLAEIKVATNNFDDVFIIGRGGFGNVYKGYIDSGTTAVAIKRLKPESSQGAHEFKTEIEMLSQLRHLHLVSLIGYCNDGREMILVYDYMARGTLREHLYDSDNPPLSWKQRLEICIGAARGLHYLHTGAKHTIIHRDVKTTNILLDEKWEANVSDFGLSRMGPTTLSKAHVSTVVKGSLGYLDPEYYRRQQLTEKSDVYSFGVVLCEVLCARPPLIRSVEKRQMSLAEWAQSCYRSGTFDEIVDKHLRGKIAPECLSKYTEIAVSCLVENGSERPSMNDVVWGLEFALQLQQNAEENLSPSGGFGDQIKGDSEVLPFLNYSENEDKFTCSWEETSELKSSGATKTSSSEQSSDTNQSNKGMSGTVFSEINDPKGR